LPAVHRLESSAAWNSMLVSPLPVGNIIVANSMGALLPANHPGVACGCIVHPSEAEASCASLWLELCCFATVYMSILMVVLDMFARYHLLDRYHHIQCAVLALR
jgi:hypothetical protein